MHEFHGQVGTRLYRIWVAMRQRCSDPKRLGYERYGGRGIRVCSEWDNSFTAFRDWALQNGYSDSLSIDRRDNDGDYTPEQNRNKSWSCLVTVDGETLTVAELARKRGLHFTTLYRRYRRGLRDAALVNFTPMRKEQGT